MAKTGRIPNLYKIVYDDSGGWYVTREANEGFDWVERGEGEATEMVDGAACAIINGTLYKKYDVRFGRDVPRGAIPCQPAPDPVTGKWPHWVACDSKKPGDRFFIRAWANTPWIGELGDPKSEGTYEAVGLHFRQNPYGLDDDFLERHGRIKVKDFPRDFDGMREYFRTHPIEGVVFWKDGQPQCKIKRSDFGFKWPTDYWRDNG